MNSTRKSTTFASRIHQALVETGRPTTTDELLDMLREPSYKINYIIDGLKKEIERGNVVRIENPKEKRLWAGHFYVLNRSNEIE